ncbi:hypothetical protein OAX78_02870, partial [Planctomycetota bacterium]|nr:hypothetical protein [Planctomycetota bacterium]
FAVSVGLGFVFPLGFGALGANAIGTDTIPIMVLAGALVWLGVALAAKFLLVNRNVIQCVRIQRNLTVLRFPNADAISQVLRESGVARG